MRDQKSIFFKFVFCFLVRTHGVVTVVAAFSRFLKGKKGSFFLFSGPHTPGVVSVVAAFSQES